MGENGLMREHITKAYALRSRVSEPERLYIEARYYQTVEGKPRKTMETYQIWIQTYPKDFVPHSNLAGLYNNTGNELDRAIDEYKTAISLAPDEPLPYGNLSSIYQTLNRPDEARQLLENAIARGVDSTTFRTELYTLAFLRHDEAEMARQETAAKRFPDGSARMMTTRLTLAIAEGQLAAAQDLAAQFTAETVAKLGLKGPAASVWSNVAQSAATFGDAAAARAAGKTALDLERSTNTLLSTAYALVICGDWQSAKKLVDEAAKLPDATGEDPQRGVNIVSALIRWRQSKSGADALPPPKDETDTGAIFTHGVVELSEGRTDAAAARFKQILDRKQQQITALKPLSSLYYGRAMIKLGKPDEARKAYQQFFESWKSPDPTLPILVEAKKEFAAVKTAG
jgi:tetratricopeptide (TPR) repeat protein